MSDLKIDGIGTYSGGIYNSVSIDGVATVNGDVSTQDFCANGVATLNGNLDCRKLGIDGVVTIKGNGGAEEITLDGVLTLRGFLHCNHLSCDGVATIGGELRAQEIELDGTMNIRGSLDAAHLRCDGMLTVNNPLHIGGKMEINGGLTAHSTVLAGHFSCDGKASLHGDLRCETYQSSGLVTVNGSKLEATHMQGDGCLSADSAQISADIVDFEGKIRADEIVGDSVTIRSKHKLMALFTKKPFASEARLIEATNVCLCGVTAGEVNGAHISLTNKCVIDRVDCSGTLYIDQSCTVGLITGNYEMI